MNLTPPFEIGVLNLWICIALTFLLPIVINPFTKTSGKRTRSTLSLPQMSAGEKVIYYTWIGVQLLTYLYSIFVPFALGSVWFYLGMIIFISGMVMMGFKTHAFRTSPADQLITSGIYKISRNPEYFALFLCYLGMGLAGLAWPLLVLAGAHFLLYQITANYEERTCARLWPDKFAEYKRKVAKNFLFF
jgi:protein-S-isoprenylcysteine O-methyltransferase Ste14